MTTFQKFTKIYKYWCILASKTKSIIYFIGKYLQLLLKIFLIAPQRPNTRIAYNGTKLYLFVYITKYRIICMSKQEIIEKFRQKLIIENYSQQTINNYVSAIRLFLEYLSKLTVKEVSDKEIQDYLFYCKTERKYSFSSIKQVVASIGYLYKKVFNKPAPDALHIELRKPTVLPAVLSVEEISKLLKVTSNVITRYLNRSGLKSSVSIKRFFRFGLPSSATFLNPGSSSEL